MQLLMMWLRTDSTDSGRRLPSENESRKSGNNSLLLKVLHDSLYLLHHFHRKPVTASLSIKQTYRMVTKKYNVWYCSALKRHILIKAFSIFLLPVPCQHVQCNSHACCKCHLSFAGQNANFSKSFLIPVPMCDGRLWILLAVRDVTPVMFRKSGLEQQSLIYRQHQVLLIGFQMHQHNIQQRQMFLVFYAFPLQNMKLSHICWKILFFVTPCRVVELDPPLGFPETPDNSEWGGYSISEHDMPVRYSCDLLRLAPHGDLCIMMYGDLSPLFIFSLSPTPISQNVLPTESRRIHLSCLIFFLYNVWTIEHDKELPSPMSHVLTQTSSIFALRDNS